MSDRSRDASDLRQRASRVTVHHQLEVESRGHPRANADFLGTHSLSLSRELSRSRYPTELVEYSAAGCGFSRGRNSLSS